MSEKTRTSKASPEQDADRIATWRAERLKVAEAEKAERIRLRDEKRRMAEVEALSARRTAAMALLPTQSEIAAEAARLQSDQRRGRWTVRGQFLGLVLLPWLAIAWYVTAVATPLYEARSVIAVTRLADPDVAQNAGLIAGASSSKTLQDVFKAHEFMQSPALADALEHETGLLSYLASAEIDPLRRLRDWPSLRIGFDFQLRQFIKSAVNIQNGLITLDVRHPDPETAIALSQRILMRTQDQINSLNSTGLSASVGLAEQKVDTAQTALQAAQSVLLRAQIDSGDVDPARRVAAIYDTIASLEAEILALGTEIERARIAGRGESFLAQQNEELRTRLQTQINVHRQSLTEPMGDGQPSLNAQLMNYQMAQLGVEMAQERLTVALDDLSAATQQAALGQSVFQIVVPPRASNVPTSPDTIPVLALVGLLLMAFFMFARVLRIGQRGAAV